MHKSIVSLVGLVVFAASMYAQHTHRTHTLTREQKIVAITILAEARGEGNAGMYAVAAVIAQRAFERKCTPESVCLKRYQFSCWNGKKLKDLEHLLKVKQGKYAILLAKTVKQLTGPRDRSLSRLSVNTHSINSNE